MSAHSLHKTIAETFLLFSFLSIALLTHCSPQSLTSTVEITHGDLEALGLTCLSWQKCKGRTGNDTLLEYTCLCGKSCAKMDSCCVDSDFRTTASSEKISNMKCLKINVKNQERIFMVDSCRPEWEGDDGVRANCSTDPEVANDPFLQVPVTSNRTGVTYRNHFCYLCNEDTDCEMPIFWNTVFSVQFPEIYYNQQEVSWMLRDGIYPDKMILSVSVPKPVKSDVFNCRHDLVAQCNSSWTDNVTREMCSSYTSIIGDQYRGTYYKNPHCALCNYEDLERLHCHSIRIQKINQGHTVTFPLTKYPVCGKNMVYDDFSRRCRPAKCTSESPTDVTLADLKSLNVWAITTRGSETECAGRGWWRDNLNSEACICGPLCMELDACCPDSPFKRDISLGRSQIECTKVYGMKSLGDRISVYTKTTCESSFEGEALIRELCAGDPESENDLTLAIQVTSLSTNVTYRNYYCFLCNEEETQPPVIWNVQLTREGVAIPSVSLEDIHFDPELKSWTIADGSIPIWITLKVPKDVERLVHSCHYGTISDCDVTWRDEVIRQKCLEYMYLTRYSAAGTLYRNPHCGFCNYEDLATSRWPYDYASGIPRPNLFVRLLDVGSGGDPPSCDTGMRYDSRANKCRPLRCLSRRYSLVNGECKKRN